MVIAGVNMDAIPTKALRTNASITRASAAAMIASSLETLGACERCHQPSIDEAVIYFAVKRDSEAGGLESTNLGICIKIC